MTTQIKCPKCGEQFEPTEAFKHELKDRVLKEAKSKHEQEVKNLKKEFEDKQQQVLATSRKEAIEKIRKEYDSKIISTKEESEEKDKQNKDLQKQLTDLMRELRAAKGAEDKLKLEYEKKMLTEQNKIKSDAKKEAEEELGLEIAQRDKKLADAEKQIKEMDRKIKQGSQQTQGEVLELKLEEILRKEFLFDEIKDVPKGIKGADVVQIVKTRNGKTCGTIVWESKNTRNWIAGWVQKLVEDQRTLKAEIAVLVSSVLPERINSFGQLDKIWVSDMKSAISLAHALRHQLIEIKGVQEASKGKEAKAEIVYNYLISNEFKQRIDVWVEYFRSRREEITKERAYYNKKWEKEDKDILRVFENTAGIYGDLQGLIGNALPKVDYLELPEETK